jgi:hypothetical protein
MQMEQKLPAHKAQQGSVYLALQRCHLLARITSQ